MNGSMLNLRPSAMADGAPTTPARFARRGSHLRREAGRQAARLPVHGTAAPRLRPRALPAVVPPAVVVRRADRAS